jgi:uncharacterized protein DUF3995
MTAPPPPRALGLLTAAAWAAFAAQSCYYAAGGRWLAHAFPPAVVEPVLDRQTGAVTVMWLAAVGKLVVAAAALAVSRRRQPLPRLARVAGWLVVAVALGYEGVSSFGQHALMAVNMIDTPDGLGRTSLWWHLGLFDPYWALLGALVAALLLRAPRHRGTSTRAARVRPPASSGRG